MSNKAVDYIKFAKDRGLLRKYKKFGTIKAVQLDKDTKVATVIDGQEETVKHAIKGEWLVTGSKGEQYAVVDDKFKSRYKHISGDTFEPVGMCFAIQYDGPSFSFMAPWGEEMICNRFDYIAATDLDFSDVYRIEKDAFKKTYKLA